MDRTEKLYLDNSFLAENTACVLAVRASTKFPNMSEVALDKSVFFPEGGGQPSDKGQILFEGCSSAVEYVFEEDELVWHCTTAKVATGDSVTCKIDFDRRLAFMQQHTGEHLLSSAAFSLYGANNVGFHLSDDSLGVDFDVVFTPAQLIEIEKLTNTYLLQSLPVIISYLSPEEYEAAPMRKKAKDIKGEIRIVNAQGIDFVTCCGTHCTNTSQVGAVKILRCEKYKSGSRVEMACGNAALKVFEEYNSIILELGKKFSVKPQLLLEAVEKNSVEIVFLKNELQAKCRQLAVHIAAELLSSTIQTPFGTLVCADVSTNAELAHDISTELSHHEVLAVVFTKIGEKLTYFTSAKGCAKSARDICNALNSAFSGKGGGSETMSQGRAVVEHCTGDEIVKIITE